MPLRLAAAAVLALEAAVLTVLLLFQVGAIVTGDTASLASALALAVLTVIGVIAVVGFAVTTARGRSAGRSGGIVVQVLILAVALGALTGETANAGAAALIAAPGVLGLVLLILAARQDARAHGEDSSPR